jgi:hypothetical protein
VSGLVSLAVNGRAVKPAIERGYAVVTREWKAGDRIELELPLTPQRITAAEQIEATRGKVALRYGPMIYNVEAADQDITKALDMTAPLTPQWRGELLGGVTVLTGKYADGSPMTAIPNYARTNRSPELAPEAGPQAADPSLYLGPTAQRITQATQIQGQRRAPRPVVSTVWMPKG